MNTVSLPAFPSHTLRALAAIAAAALALLIAGPALAQTPPPAAAPPVAAPASPAPAAPENAPPATAAPAPAPQTAAPEGSAGNFVDVAARPALTLEGQSTWDNSYTSILNAFQLLQAEVKRAGLKATGRPIAVFVFTDDAGFRFRAMLPLAAPPANPTLGAEFALGETPSGRAMKFEHRGAYDDIDATYEAITAWLDDRNLLADDFFAEEWVAEGTSAGDVETAVDVYVFIKRK